MQLFFFLIVVLYRFIVVISGCMINLNLVENIFFSLLSIRSKTGEANVKMHLQMENRTITLTAFNFMRK